MNECLFNLIIVSNFFFSSTWQQTQRPSLHPGLQHLPGVNAIKPFSSLMMWQKQARVFVPSKLNKAYLDGKTPTSSQSLPITSMQAYVASLYVTKSLIILTHGVIAIKPFSSLMMWQKQARVFLSKIEDFPSGLLPRGQGSWPREVRNDKHASLCFLFRCDKNV